MKIKNGNNYIRILIVKKQKKRPEGLFSSWIGLDQNGTISPNWVNVGLAAVHVLTVTVGPAVTG